MKLWVWLFAQHSLNFLNLICLLAAEITRTWKLKGDAQLLVGSLSTFVQYRFSFDWCGGSLVEMNTITVLLLSALQQMLMSSSRQTPCRSTNYWILLLLSVALPFLPYLGVMLLMPKQTASSERRGEWEIQPSRQTNTSYLTSHLAADRHGGSVQVPTVFPGLLSLASRMLPCSCSLGSFQMATYSRGELLMFNW